MNNYAAKAQLLSLLTLCAFATLSCTSPQAVSTFAGDAQKTFDQGPALFRDLEASCVRRHRDAEPVVALYRPPVSSTPAAPPEEAAVCQAFAPRAEALIRASGVVSAYFKALEQLASFNTSSVSTDSEQAATNAATAAQLDPSQIDSVGKLAGIVMQAFTAHYQRRHLLEALRQADSALGSATQGFQTVVGTDYESLLASERRALVSRYQEVGETGDRATVLLLNRAYSDDLQQLDRRKAAADAYVQALLEIREGHHQLALNAGRLGAKELSLAIEPYTSRLQTLLPRVQQAF